MTTLIILAAVYLLSAYLLRELFIREKLTDKAAMFLVVFPLVNTVGILVVLVAIIVDSLQGKFNWDEIAKRFFGKID
jgi:hypothetical protein